MMHAGEIALNKYREVSPKKRVFESVLTYLHNVCIYRQWMQ